MKKSIVFSALSALALFAAAAWGGASNKTSSADIAKGAQLFKQRCTFCHNANNDEKKVGPGLKGLFHHAKLANGQAANEQNITALIENGAKGMPPYAKVLSKDQVANLIAYLKTL